MKRLAGIGALFLVVAAVAGAAGSATPEARAKPAALKKFSTCGELLDYAKRNARRIVRPWGLAGQPAVRTDLGQTPTTGGAPRSAPSEAAQAGVDYSTTNVQEEGVDEPDIVKTNGKHLFALAYGKLHAVDVSDGRAKLVGSLGLEKTWGHSLFLSKNRVLVFAHGSFGPQPQPVPDGPVASSIAPAVSGTVITEVDVSNPAAMKVVRTLELEGMYVSARLIGRSVRVVLTSGLPYRIQFTPPAAEGAAAARQATEQNRRAIDASSVKNWLPASVVRNARTGETKERPLVQCRHVRRTAAFSGTEMMTVLTLDLDKGLEPVDSDAVMGNAQIVYASRESLYVATQRWGQFPVPGETFRTPQKATTALHKFDISNPANAHYRASGEVSGYVLNQWSLSEHKGLLRVATTESPAGWSDDGVPDQDSSVTVLRGEAGKLVQVGRVGGLGKGERIFGVRFIGDTGYVVTFRQIDPLYVLDLSKPDAPRVAGELKIPGYSAYLHPIGPDLLIGVGQDATDEGRALGTQVALFDVSNPARPQRLAKQTIGRGWSEAEHDHHAFLYWARAKLAVIPVQAYSENGQGFVGVVGFRVARETGVNELARISHASGELPAARRWTAAPMIRRSLVVRDALYTVSDAGVKASALDTLTHRTFVAFPQPEPQPEPEPKPIPLPQPRP